MIRHPLYMARVVNFFRNKLNKLKWNMHYISKNVFFEERIMLNSIRHSVSSDTGLKCKAVRGLHCFSI